MNNDLISREALKEKAETVTLWNGEVRRFVSYETIDNAEPVEYTFEEAFQKTVCANKLYCPARPHGKWKKQNCFYKCSVCGVYSPDGTDLHNYCPNCGAKMDGKEADNDKID